MQRQLCLLCGRLHPANAKQCHPCRNGTLYTEICTSQARIAEYFEILRRGGLWPTNVAFRTLSVSGLVAAISGLQNDQRHQCDTGLNCPLKKEVKRLALIVKQVTEGIHGIDFAAGEGVNSDD